MQQQRSNNRILQQVILLIIIVSMSYVIYRELSFFISAFLGSVTLYVLLKRFQYILTTRWRMGGVLAASIITGSTFVVLAGILFLTVDILYIKLSTMDYSSMEASIMQLKDRIFALTGSTKINSEHVTTFISKVAGFASSFIASIFNITYSFFVNLFSMLFILFFMLVNSGKLERVLPQFMPFSHVSRRMIQRESYNMILSNAIGIPTVMLLQGLAAALGYYMFGVESFAFWGLLTGFCSVIPIVGTAIVWFPLSLVFILSNDLVHGIGLLLYCVVVVTSLDSVGRFLVLKKISDTHPLITLFGVIMGIQFFGFWGIIFGPLLLSSTFLLLKIYKNEYLDSVPEQQEESTDDSNKS